MTYLNGFKYIKENIMSGDYLEIDSNNLGVEVVKKRVLCLLVDVDGCSGIVSKKGIDLLKQKSQDVRSLNALLFHRKILQEKLVKIFKAGGFNHIEEFSGTNRVSKSIDEELKRLHGITALDALVDLKEGLEGELRRVVKFNGDQIFAYDKNLIRVEVPSNLGGCIINITVKKAKEELETRYTEMRNAIHDGMFQTDKRKKFPINRYDSYVGWSEG